MPYPSLDEYVAVMEALMPALKLIERTASMTSVHAIACLQAGRLLADYDALQSVASGLDADFALYVATREFADLTIAPELIHVQQCRVRAVLIAMGKLNPEYA